MKADLLHYRCVPIRGCQRTTRNVLTALAVLCLAAIVTTGCQFGHGHHAAAETHYGQLEQACFGYEPTVWRTMASDCEQAIRLIPNEVVQTPPATPAPPVAKPIPNALPLDEVPEPGQELVPRIVEGFTNPDKEQPTPSTDAPAESPTEPAAEPATEFVPEPGMPAPSPAPKQPAGPEPTPAADQPPPVEEPKSNEEDTPPAAEPQTPPATTPATPPTTPPTTSRRATRTSASPVALRTPMNTSAAANELFRSMEHALKETPRENAQPILTHAADQQSAVGLARFITY